MRPIRLASLVLLGLLLGGGCAEAGNGRPGKPRVRPAAETPGKPIRTFDVTGYGETYEDAYDRALKEAQEQLTVFLAAQDPTLDWRPPLAFVRTLVHGQPEEGTKDLEKLGTLREVKLHLTLSAGEVRHLQEKAVEHRSAQRMLALGKVLVGLVVLFAAVAGYFRVEEATKGYYTAWLRLGVLGLMAAVALALLVIG